METLRSAWIRILIVICKSAQLFLLHKVICRPKRILYGATMKGELSENARTNPHNRPHQQQGLKNNGTKKFDLSIVSLHH